MEYLSDEWIEAANQALAQTPANFADASVTIVQKIRGVRSYMIAVQNGAASLVACDNTELPARALCFEQDWATACSIAQHTTDAHQAFLLGDIAFSGDTAALIASSGVLADIAAALEPVMTVTTFPERFEQN